MEELPTKNWTFKDNFSTPFQIYQIAQRFFVIPAVISVILNAYVIRCIYQSKDLLKSSTYRYIANMVLSDLSSGSLFVVLPLMSFFDLPYIIADIICRFISYITGVTYIASILSLVAVSADRYRSIVLSKPLNFRTKRLKKSKRLITAIWLISVTFSVPLIYVTGAISIENKTCAILDRGMWNAIYFFSITTLLYVIPLIIMSILYFKIYQYLKHNTHIAMKSNSNLILRMNTKFLNHSKMKDIIKTLIIITIAFASMTWPFFAMTLGTAISRLDIRDLVETSLPLFYLAVLAASSTVTTSITNPILLICLDKNIGKNKLCPFLGKRLHQVHIKSSSDDSDRRFKEPTDKITKQFDKFPSCE